MGGFLSRGITTGPAGAAGATGAAGPAGPAPSGSADDAVYLSASGVAAARSEAAQLGVVASTRGDLIRRGASAVERFAAVTADTFVGGDGTDVTTRTAAQVRTSLAVSARISVGGVAAAADGIGGETGQVQPAMGLGSVLVVWFYKVRNLTADNTFCFHGDDTNAVSGWQLYANNTGKLLTMFGVGFVPTTATTVNYDSLAVGWHAIACYIKDLGAGNREVRYSVDGGAVAASAAFTGTYAPPVSGDKMHLCRQGAGTGPMIDAELGAVYCATGTPTDADLQTLSTLGATSEVPTVAGLTGTFDWSARQHLTPGYSNTLSGSRGSAVWDLTVPVNARPKSR